MAQTQVTTDVIADDAVTTAKIADNAITSAKIGVDLIIAEDLAANSITVSEITDGVITEAKLNLNSPTNDHVLTADSTTAGGYKWAAAGGAYNDWSIITAALNPLVDKTQYISKNASALTHTLPSGTDVGRTIIMHNAGAGAVTLARNGQPINSTATDAILLTNRSTQLVYVDATIGWKEI